MSGIKRMIELKPRAEVKKEMVVSCGHKCPMCNGTGKRLVADESAEMGHWERCRMCDGSGELDAVVCIEWRAKS